MLLTAEEGESSSRGLPFILAKVTVFSAAAALVKVTSYLVLPLVMISTTGKRQGLGRKRAGVRGIKVLGIGSGPNSGTPVHVHGPIPVDRESWLVTWKLEHSRMVVGNGMEWDLDGHWLHADHLSATAICAVPD